MSDGPLLIERRPDRIVAALHRPDKRNAIDQAMIDALHELCAELESTPRTLILTGTGGTFAAGADIAQLRDRRAEDALRGINATAFIRISELPMPVIAAIDGYALGGGAELAYAADIRIGSSDLKIGNPETGLGIIAAAGATWRLREIVGDARASELLLTGRILDADEALAAGLVSSVHPSGRAARRGACHRRPHRGERSARDPAHQARAARPARPASRDRRRAAGGAVREPREAAPHDGRSSRSGAAR